VGTFTASQRQFMGLVTEQSLYDLASRTVEFEVVPPPCATTASA
jgi:hypothetical protein